MLTEETAHLSVECNSWREQLRSEYVNMSQLLDRLQDMARGIQDKETLKLVDHYHNQFYIQQINIHDLKQAIRSNEKKLHIPNPEEAHVLEHIIEEHKDLGEQFANLEHTLTELKADFDTFVTKVPA